MRRRLFFGAVALVASGFRRLFAQPIEPAITMSLSGKNLPYPLQQGVLYHVSVMKEGTFKIVSTPGGKQIEVVYEERTNG